MVGSDTLRDSRPKDGPARGRPEQAAPAKSRPAWRRVPGLLGGWIALPFSAVGWAGVAAVGAATWLVRVLARVAQGLKGLIQGFAGFARGPMRWDAIAALGAVVAAAASVMAWSKSVDTETRQVTSE